MASPRHYSKNTFSLQEVPRWGKLRKLSFRYGHFFFKLRTSDCGISVPMRLRGEVCEHGVGRYWCGLLVGRLCLLSAHLRTGITGAQQERLGVLAEMTAFIRRCQAKYGDVEIVLGS